MNFRLTAILFAVVLALVVGLLIYALTSTDPTASTTGPFAALTADGVKADAVTVVEIARTSPVEEKLVFEKAGGKWRLTSPPNAGVDSAALDALVSTLLELKPVEYAGVMERSNTGLTKPEVTLTLRAGDKSASVHVGDTTFGNDRSAVTFMVSATDPEIRPMAVPTGKLRASLFRADAKDGKPATLVKWRSDFRSRGLLSGEARDPESETDAITVGRGDKTLTLTRKDRDWRITQPPLGLADVAGASVPDAGRFTGVRPLLNSLLTLQISGSADVTEGVSVADLGRYGLSAADSPLKVTYTAKAKPPQTLLVGKRLTDKDGKPVVPPRHYLKLDGDAAVFAVSTDIVEKLANTLNDPTTLQNRDLVPQSRLAQIDAIDSSAGGGFKLRKLVGGTDPWGLYGGGDPIDAQLQAVQTVLNRLTTPRVATEVLPKPDDAAFTGANLQGVLKVWFSAVNKDKAKLSEGKLPAEPAAEGESITLQFGKQFTKKVTLAEGTTEERPFAIVRRTTGTESTDLEVPQEVVSIALQPRIKFVNARPPSFPVVQASGLVLFRNGQRSEFVKNPTANDPAYPRGVWNIGDTKGPVADSDVIFELLSRLTMLSSAPLVLEKADDPKALGLDPANPKTSAKVTLPGEKGGTRTEEFHFGEAVKGDDKSVYFKSVDKPFVYAVGADLANALRTADLADKVAFRIDPTRVKEITIRGWAAAADKTPVKVEAALQNGVWVATEPKGATLDSGRLYGWLEALRSPKTIGPAPVEPGKDPPATYGLGFQAVKLLIVSKGAKDGDPDVGLDVTVGALTADKKGVYVRLSDGRVFLVDAGPFPELLSRPPLAAK